MANMIPKLVGLKTCLPLYRIKNLDEMVAIPAKDMTQAESTLKSKQSPSALISALLTEVKG
jgi:hypothetical protein